MRTLNKKYTLPVNKGHALIGSFSYVFLLSWWLALYRIDSTPWMWDPMEPKVVYIVQMATLIVSMIAILIGARSESRLASYYVRYGLWRKWGLFLLFMLFPVGDVLYLLTGRPALVYSIFMDIPMLSSIKICDFIKEKYYAYAQDELDPVVVVATPIGGITVLIREETAQLQLFIIEKESSICPNRKIPPEWTLDYSQEGDAYAFAATQPYYPECRESDIGEIIVDIIDKLVEVLNYVD